MLCLHSDLHGGVRLSRTILNIIKSVCGSTDTHTAADQEA